MNFENFEDVASFDEESHFSVKVTGKNRVEGINSFDDPNLGLHPTILQNVESRGYVTPKPIQCYGMPQLMANLDIMCCSCTGSGKTASYLLPVINMILKETDDETSRGKGCPKAVILTPTRELAEQVCRDSKQYSENLPITSLAVFGGDNLSRELTKLKRFKTDILVATPGRLLHLLSDFSNHLSLKHTKYLVIDEADEMFDKNFFPDINCIVKDFMKPKEERVTAMYSATFPIQVQYYAKKHLRPEFVFVVVGTIGGAAPDIIQEVIPTAECEKLVKLLEILQEEAERKILIFSNTILKVDMLVNFLRGRKLKPTYIHSEIEQSSRDLAIHEFNDGLKRILVATSVAARGLNIKDVAVVINYDLPDTIEDYVQRIGRVRTTGNGNLGVAKSFFNEDTDADLLPDLKFALKSANQPIPEFMLENTEMIAEYVDEMDEYLDEDVLNKLKKFKIPKTFESAEDTDWWG